MENDEFLSILDHDADITEDVFESNFDEPLFEEVNEPTEGGNPPEDNNKNTEDDAILTYLKEKGIADPNNILIGNEDGQQEKVSFYNLTREEQLELLREKDENQELDDDEVNLINYLRTNQLKFDDVIEYAKQQGVQEYINKQQLEVDVNSLTDDEVFLTDLLSRIPDITDDEAQQALELEKQNETLYSRKVQALRNDLLQKEEQRIKEQNDYIEAQKAEQFNEFKNNLLTAASSLKDIGNIELDESDLNETVDFLLAEDATGVRYIAKALNDPTALLKMAWFYIKGEEAINYMSEYYENQIKEYSKHNYEKGYADAKSGKQPEKGSRVVKKNSNQVSSQSLFADEYPIKEIN